MDGRSLVLKHACVADDWVIRATGEVKPRIVTAWETGLLAGLPS